MGPPTLVDGDLPLAGPVDLRPFASMGPPTRVDGDRRCSTPTHRSTLSFNGAADSRRRRRARRVSTSRRSPRLQWGRRLSSTETGAVRAGLAMLGAASMGPPTLVD